MLKALRFLRTWFLVSIPLGLFVGRFIKAGKGPPHQFRCQNMPYADISNVAPLLAGTEARTKCVS